MLRSGFGARTAKSNSSTSAGRQTVADRGKGADSVIRAIAGTDMAIWLDADDITGVATGATLSTWAAKAGNPPLQGATGKQPNYQASGFNDRPAVQFDAGRIDTFQWPPGVTGVGINASNMRTNTVASVTIRTTSGLDAQLFELGATYWNNTDGLAQGYASFNSLSTLLGNGADSYESSTKAMCPNENNVFVSTYNRTPNPWVLGSYINSEPITVRGGANYSYDDSDTNWLTNIAFLGSRAETSLPMAGSIREFIVLNRDITAGEAFRLGKALMAKSGLTKLLSGYSQQSSHFKVLITIY